MAAAIDWDAVQRATRDGTRDALTPNEALAALINAAHVTTHQLWQFTRERPDAASADVQLHAAIAYDHIERAQRHTTRTDTEGAAHA